MRRFLLATALPIVFAACSVEGEADANAAQSNEAAPAGAVTAEGAAPILQLSGATNAATRPFQSAVVADFTSPWAMSFLPDGRILVTEKAGQMLLLSNDGRTRTSVSGVPAVDSAGQGGLMDVVPHPRFTENGLVYFSYSEARDGGKNVVLARARLEAGEGSARLSDVQTLLRAEPVDGNGHYSGRIAFAPDGHLFFTAGDRQKMEPAQDRQGLLGKVLRLTDEGRPAPGNPLAEQGFRPEVWSYGHRNLLGIAFDSDGNLWQQEMGPEGGDELNLVLPGRNYGWPRASQGVHYDGRPIPDHAAGDGFEAPKVAWVPAISPAGLTYYNADLFPGWRNSVFIGAMNQPGLVRVQLDGTRATLAEKWDMDGQRVREVETGPDGALWLLEDGQRGSQGRLLRLTPAEG